MNAGQIKVRIGTVNCSYSAGPNDVRGGAASSGSIRFFGAAAHVIRARGIGTVDFPYSDPILARLCCKLQKYSSSIGYKLILKQPR